MTTFADRAEFENALCVGESEKALLVKLPELEKPVWIPKSQVDDDSEVYGADPRENKGTLIVSQWIAEQKDLV